MNKMTMPDERYRSLVKTEEFLKKLLTSDETPPNIKDDALWCLRHYPTRYDLDILSESCPEILQKNAI